MNKELAKFLERATPAHGAPAPGKRAPRAPRQATKPQPPVPKEDEVQSACVFWFGLQYPCFRRLLHHSPNESAYDQARRANSMGMQKGFPDLFLAVPRGVYHGAMIEMKSTRNGAKPSPEEREMLELLSAQGYYCAVCYGFESFRNTTIHYLELEPGAKL